MDKKIITEARTSSVAFGMHSTLQELLEATAGAGLPKAVARFDAGGGRDIAFVCFAGDAEGYLQVIEAYEQGRDAYANQVANAVTADIAENGLPTKGEPRSFKIIDMGLEK